MKQTSNSPFSRAASIAIILLIALTTDSFSQITEGTDNANNYTLGQNLNGANLGTGFGPWSIVSNDDGTSVFASAFVGNNTTQNGRASIGSPSQVFGLYANTTNNGTTAFVDLRRTFAGGAAMTKGNSFSWQGSWSWNGGNRGFELYSGNFSSTLLNLSYGGSDALTFSVSGGGNGTLLPNIFNQAFTVTMTFNGGSQNSLRLQANTSNQSYDQTHNLQGVPASFKWYFAGAPDNSQNYEPFINNLTAVPEPSTWALIGLGTAFVLWRVRRRVHGVG